MSPADDADEVDADRPAPARRAAALGALALAAAAVAMGLVAVAGDVWRLLVLPVLLACLIAATFTAATRRGALRLMASTVAVILLAGGFVLILTADAGGLGALAVLALVAAATALARHALRRDLRSLKARPVPGDPVPPASRGVLLLNLRSGGGKAERFALVEECQRRGIEPVVLQPGDDLLELARERGGPWCRRARHGRR